MVGDHLLAVDQDVLAAIEVDSISSGTAVDLVATTVVGEDGISTSAARNGVLPWKIGVLLRVDVVSPRSAKEEVVASVAFERVVAFAALETVVPVQR